MESRLSNIKLLSHGIINSYSQVFFSDHRILAIILLLVSFADPNAGLAGLSSVVITNLIAYSLGFYKKDIETGLFGFNSLLVGLGIGYFFEPSPELFLIIFAASVLTLLFVTLLKGILYKYGLPYLSMPFLFGIWTVMISSNYFEALGISQKGLFTINKLYGLGGNTLVEFYERLSNVQINDSLRTYFLSIGAIFFQFKILPGLLISLGLLFYSRIAFILSLYGFYTAYLFYMILGGNIAELSYSYIGFNYILTAIAIGGFYLVPSKKTFLWLLILIPVVTMLTLSLAQVFSVFKLSIYSLPFNIVVLLFIYSLKFRLNPSDDLKEVLIQQNNPEKNLYSYQNQRINNYHRNLIPFILPFYGKWTVSQAHEGEYTHKEEWRHAWDFIITDHNESQFKNNGDFHQDYYCFGKDVLAPASGTVEEIINDIPDNEIGKTNLVSNWGNSIIIKHSDHLFSSLNHLKYHSITVEPGDNVSVGQKIGEVGNSGRSPYPHLHFQFQATPFVGSKTIDYPISYYILDANNHYDFKAFDKPLKNDMISNVDTFDLMKKSLDFIPGQKLEIQHTQNGKQQKETWEVETSAWNESYLKDPDSGSIAYFVNDNYLLYFTHFEGNRKSLLYFFYLSFYKVLQSYYKNINLKDELPLNKTFHFPLLTIQDFIAPFYIFLRSEYNLRYAAVDNELHPGEIHLKSQMVKTVFQKEISRQEFVVKIKEGELHLKSKMPGNEFEATIFT